MASRGAFERRAAPVLVAVLAVPLLVAVIAQSDPHWHANLDLALTELRVRDVGWVHPPLVGLSGRIEAFGVPGSHPGPVSFWLLAPAYGVLGGTSWALVAATALLALVTVALAVWIGHRRGGWQGALAVAAGAAVLLQAVGPEHWSQPWNPYLPLLWWPVFLLAAWSVLCEDRPMIPVAVVAGTFCAQTHVAYVGLVAAVGLVAVAIVGVGTVRHRTDRDRLRRTLAWSGLGMLALVVLWALPVYEQLHGDPGNLGILREQFGHPSEPSVGIGRGVGLWLRGLDPVALVTGRIDLDGPVWPGLVLVAGWGAAAVAAWRRGSRELGLLHVVVGVALATGLVSIARIQGQVFEYLLMWSSGTAVVALGASLATVAVAVDARGATSPGLSRAGRAAPVGLTAVLVVAAAATTWEAARGTPPQPGQAAVNTALLPEAVDALRAEGAPGGGIDGRYLVRSDDPVSGGLNTFTLLLELERRGFQVGVEEWAAVSARPFRLLAPQDATAVVTYVVGPAIEDWRARPGAVEIAHAEPPPGSAARFDRISDQVAADLRGAGLPELAATFEDELLVAATDPDLPPDAVDGIRQMVEVGQPTSIFVSPAEG
jgi:hypothetical protein